MLAIHANNGQVFISNPKHSKIALNTEQKIHCCSHELYEEGWWSCWIPMMNENLNLLSLKKCPLTVDKQSWSNLRHQSCVQNPQEEMMCVHQQGIWNLLLTYPTRKQNTEKSYILLQQHLCCVYFHQLFLN